MAVDDVDAWSLYLESRGVAVEPMTAYADAFRTGKDLVVLEPGDDYTTVVTFHAEQI